MVAAPLPAVAAAAMESEPEYVPETIRTPRARSLLTGGHKYTALVAISQEGLRRPHISQLLRAAGITVAALLLLTFLASGALAGPQLMGSWLQRGSSEFLQQSWQLDCANDGDNCWTSRCCKDASKTCFAHSEGWAQCGIQCSRNALGAGQDP